MVRPELVRLLSQHGKTTEVKEEVPIVQITDWRELAERRDHCFGNSAYHQQVCARMTEVLQEILPNITSLYRLSAMWKEALSDSDDEKRIEASFQAAAQTITDWYELNDLLNRTSYPKTLVIAVRERIAYLITEVSAEKCPDWFLALLRDPNSCVVRDVLKQKIEELKKELNIAD
jgi:hypothetical protein